MRSHESTLHTWKFICQKGTKKCVNFSIEKLENKMFKSELMYLLVHLCWETFWQRRHSCRCSSSSSFFAFHLQTCEELPPAEHTLIYYSVFGITMWTLLISISLQMRSERLPLVYQWKSMMNWTLTASSVWSCWPELSDPHSCVSVQGQSSQKIWKYKEKWNQWMNMTFVIVHYRSK